MSYSPVGQYIDLLLKNKRPSYIETGSRGYWVRSLRRLLAYHGYDNIDYVNPEIAVPDSFDDDTQEAVYDFQASNGLGYDGEVGPETWAWLGCWDTLDIGERTLAVARREFLSHAREIGGNNRGKFVEKYLRATGYQSVAWCVAFATWCACVASGDSLKHTQENERLSSSRLVRAAGKKNLFTLSSVMAQPGDFVIIKGGPTGWRHTALLQKIAGNYAYVIEGNVRGGDTDEPRYRVWGSRDAVKHGRYTLDKVAFVQQPEQV